MHTGWLFFFCSAEQTEDQWADHFDLVKGLASSRHDPDKKEMTALQYYDLFQGSYVHKPVRHTSKHDDLWQQLAKKHKCNPKLGHCFVCEADEEEGAEGEDSEEEDPNYDPKDN